MEMEMEPKQTFEADVPAFGRADLLQLQVPVQDLIFRNTVGTSLVPAFGKPGIL